MKKHIFFLAILPLIACERTIDFDGDIADPMIVADPVNYYGQGSIDIGSFGFNPEHQGVEILTSTSVSILDVGTPQPLDNVVVELREQGQTWTVINQQVTEGFYRDVNFDIQSGKTYEFRASHPDYDKVSASFTVPQKVEIDSVVRGELVEGDTINWESSYLSANLHFKDPGGERYYSMSAFFVDSTQPEPNVTRLRITSVSPFTLGLSDGDFEYYEDHLFATNELFSGKQVDIPFQIEMGGFLPSPSQKIVVILRSMDVHSFRYHSSIQRYSRFGGSGDPFAQPIQVYSNMNGGLGYMGAYSHDIKSER